METKNKLLIGIFSVLLILGGGSYIVFDFEGEALSLSDIRAILSDKNFLDTDLFMLSNVSGTRLELIGRSTLDDVEFYRYQYRDDYVKTYLGKSLILKSYWQIFEGSSGIWFNDKELPELVVSKVDNGEYDEYAWVSFSIDYFKDSRHTDEVGLFNRKVKVHPNVQKETITWIPIDQDTKYNFKWITELNGYNGESINFLAEGLCEYEHRGVVVSWCDSVKEVTSARLSKSSGKLVIRYKSQSGPRIIDPEIYVPVKIKQTAIESCVNKYFVEKNITECCVWEMQLMPNQTTMSVCTKTCVEYYNVTEYTIDSVVEKVCTKVGLQVDEHEILYSKGNRNCVNTTNTVCCWDVRGGGTNLDSRTEKYKDTVRDGESGKCLNTETMTIKQDHTNFKEEIQLW